LKPSVPITEALIQVAQRFRQDLHPMRTERFSLRNWRSARHIIPAKLSKPTLVADASAAIQKAATSGGVQLGPIRESAARPSAKELAAMQLEGLGPIPALLSFLYRLETLGYH